MAPRKQFDDLIRFLVGGEDQGDGGAPQLQKRIAVTRSGQQVQLPAQAAAQPGGASEADLAVAGRSYQAPLNEAVRRIGSQPPPAPEQQEEQPMSAATGAASIGLPEIPVAPQVSTEDLQRRHQLEQQFTQYSQPIVEHDPRLQLSKGRSAARIIGGILSGNDYQGAAKRYRMEQVVGTQQRNRKMTEEELARMDKNESSSDREFGNRMQVFNATLAKVRLQREMDKNDHPDNPEGWALALDDYDAYLKKNGKPDSLTRDQRQAWATGGKTALEAMIKSDNEDPAKLVKKRLGELKAFADQGVELSQDEARRYLLLGPEGIKRDIIPNPGHTQSKEELWVSSFRRKYKREPSPEEIQSGRMEAEGQLTAGQRKAKRDADTKKATALEKAKTRYKTGLKTASDQGTKDRLADEYASAQQEAVNTAENEYDDADLPYTHFNVRVAGPQSAAPPAAPAPAPTPPAAKEAPAGKPVPAPTGKGKQYGASLSQGDRVTIGKEAMEVVEVRRNPQTGEEAYKLKNGKWIRQSQLQPVQK